ncbi:MAG: hypothetical protein H6Q14_3019 [Bacteroidetes bacterium]|jgi:hypothetical protein|nr:hypothetical protein [Bacteroidota bacterium]
MNILDYIKGSKKGKSAQKFEQQLMRDPFLAEAMEGYEKVKGNHSLIIARLQKQVSKKAKRKRFRHPMFIWSTITSAVAIVAFIAFFFLGGFHLHFRGQKQLGVSGKPAPYSHDSATTMEASPITSANDTIRCIDMSKNGKEAVGRKPIIQPLAKDKRATRKSSIAQSKNYEKGASTTAEKKTPSQNAAKYPNIPNLPLMKTDNAEPTEISGTVTDAKGNPLVGVKITTGNSPDIHTDIRGRFTLKNVLKGQLISFSYIGFKSEEIAVSEETDQLFNVVILNENNDLLSQQVIISKDKWKSPNSKKAVQRASPAIGLKSYQSYIEKNKVKATSDGCKDKKGKVKVAFSTDENGRPYNIRVLQKLCTEYDCQTITLINNGPAWTADCEEVEYEVKY